MWHKHLQKKLPLARVDISRVFCTFFFTSFTRLIFQLEKGKTGNVFFAECPYVIKDLPKVTDKVLCLCSFVPFNVPNGCQIAIVVLVIPRFVTPQLSFFFYCGILHKRKSPRREQGEQRAGEMGKQNCRVPQREKGSRKI